MSIQGIVLLDLIGIGLIILILNFVRTKKLHVGYAVIWCLAIAGMMIIISIPPILSFVTTAVGAIFPASALSLLAFLFIFLLLIYFSVQLSLLSERQTALIQELALRDVAKDASEKDVDRSDG